MHVKRFYAKDMAKALKKVRAELGSDAVILSNQMVKDGVEVVAAQDYELESEVSSSDKPLHLSRELEKTKRDLVLSGVNGRAYHDKSIARENLSAQPGPVRTNNPETYKASNISTTPNNNHKNFRRQSSEDSNANKEALRKELALLKEKREIKQRQQVMGSGGVNRNNYKKTDGYEKTTVFDVDRHKEQDSGLTLVHSELNNIKALLESQFNGIAWQNFARHTPIQASILKRLLAMGLSASVTDGLLKKLDSGLSMINAWRRTLANLAKKIPVVNDDLADKGGIIALVGPAGAGKTTTIGKLAARYVMQHGAETVGLISVDTYRIAGHEQLRAFARILGVPLRIVDHSDKLKHTLDEYHRKKLILIDTAGLHPQDTQFKHQLNLLKGTVETIQTLLVLSCTSQLQVLKAAWQAYKSLGISGCILTKLDEAGNLGAALEVVINQQLTVAYETNGQHIPDDIHISRPHSLVAQAVSLADAAVDEQTLSNEFARVTGNNGLLEKDRLNGAA